MENDIKIPNHVAIILDGNGRWATSRGLARTEGHYQGFNNLEILSRHIFNKGIKILSVYAFSTENFKRSKEEVDYLMNLFPVALKKFKKMSDKDNYRIVFSGRREPLPKKVLNVIDKLTEETKNNTNGIFNICVNYGGHAEIVDTCKKIAKLVNEDNLKIDDINEQVFEHNLYNDLPPIDLLIRTSGEYRISNYMLWQLSYAEFIFTETPFPDFNEQEFDKALLEYTKRDRRFGGINYDQKSN